MSSENIYVNPETGLTYLYGGDGANCTVSACPIEMSVYGYRPSLPFSSTIIALYGLCMAVQIFLGIRYKKWGFMAAMILGCTSEIIGYVGRILYYQNPWGGAGFIIQIVLITLAPVFFAAAIYVLIYMIAVYIDPAASRVNPKFFYWLFIPSDIISLILQATGGAMSSTSNGESQSGVNIALAGLIVQVITLAFFSVCVMDYMIRSRNTWMNAKVPARFISFCVFLALATLFILTAARTEMVILAAFCLLPAHPGFVFKDGATLTGRNETRYEEPKNAEGHSSGDNIA